MEAWRDFVCDYYHFGDHRSCNTNFGDVKNFGDVSKFSDMNVGLDQVNDDGKDAARRFLQTGV